MHRLATLPGGWQPGEDGVVFIDQTPAPLVILTAADTDIQTLNLALTLAPAGLGPVRVASLLNLQQQLSIDTYAETVLSQARGILLRILGGRAYWSYGLEVVKALAQKTACALVVLPGDDQPDLDLMSHSTLPMAIVNQLWQYFVEGGPDNFCQGLLFFSDHCLATQYQPSKAQPVPKVGLYQPPDVAAVRAMPMPVESAQVAILFYRSHYLAGNTAPIDALCEALLARQLIPVAVYVSSLKDPDIQQDLLQLLGSIDLVLNTTSFAIANLTEAQPNFWQRLDVPVLQVVLSGGTLAQWQQRPQGLAPRDMAMNVALPEVDGRIITRAVSFKSITQQAPQLETEVVTYQPVCDRIQFVTTLAAHWVRLRRKSPADRKIALVLANYPNRDGRLANGVGLDTPTSCLRILQALQTAGYRVQDLPTSGDNLIQQLTQTQTNDPEGFGLRQISQSLALSDYQAYFDQLPDPVQQAIQARWGTPQQEIQRFDPLPTGTGHPSLPIAGLTLGNLFVGIQPSRGYDIDPSLNYHAPDLEPTHTYLAFYHWLRTVFQADAIVHVGKHGNLEWLPGKSIALSDTCYPELAFGPLPHLYPFIVNDPGEGAQAKRRAQAVIIDHLTPPLTRAELYGPLQQLESLVDEYYDAQVMDPSRLPVIGEKIAAVLAESHLIDELGKGEQGTGNREEEDPSDRTPGKREGTFPLSPFTLYPSSFPLPPDLLPQIDGYLCELKEAQIRDGLHVFGECPSGRQLRDLVVAIARHPGPSRLGLTRAIAADWGLDFDPLTADPTVSLSEDLRTSLLKLLTPEALSVTPPLPADLAHCRTPRDLIDCLEQYAATLVDPLLLPLASTAPPPHRPTAPALQPELHWLQTTLLPALGQTSQELTHLLRGLDGRYVPAGPSGAPTRNRPEVLPTGRNFYSVDIRALPTESAWEVGRKAAEVLVETYTQEHGDYPRTLGLSMWGTAAMRTGGDDLAEALALLGVRPVWDGPSRRVVDFEILPLSALGRPRVDVTLRISGFFRDAFANLIDLFDQAVAAVAALPEPPEQNPLAAQVQQETDYWQQQGLPAEQARMRSHLRIFGSKPGAYGAGLQGLIEAQNWTCDEDLARAYINWSSYAYTGEGVGRSAPEAFQQRLSQMQIVLHNQDNREHDLLDSDDYYQFQGGLTAAVKALSGQQPQTYFGDHAVAENPKVRTLKAEIARVYRSRVVNPKWIAGVMRHGYKGAFEMAATVDYLFAYDATTGCGADYMYEGIAQAYLLDPTVSAFIEKANPWALRDMAERLLEAHQRQLWPTADPALVESLRNIAHAAEGILENR
jgi:cobaltochelatase CobN